MKRLFSTVLLAAALGLAALPARAQEGTWTAHTSLRESTDLDAAPEAVWVATTGGVYRYAVADGAVRRYTAAEGLHDVRTEAVAYDAARGAVWLGYQDGVLDRIDLDDDGITSLRDIARAEQFSTRGVNRLVLRGDSLLVAAAFGLVVFDPERLEVRDTFSRFGTLPAATPVYDVAVGPAPTGETAFWVATGEGVAWAPLTARNLQDPATWTVDETPFGGAEPRALAFFEGTLYVGTTGDLFRRTDAGYERLNVSGEGVASLVPAAGRLLGVERFRVFSVEPDGRVRKFASGAFNTPTDVALGPDGRVWIADGEEGLVAGTLPATGTAFEPDLVTFPDGPFHGFFADLAVAPDGSLWAGGPEATVAGTGLYHLTTDGDWISYIARNVPVLQGASRFERVHVAADGTAYGASQGAGVMEVAPDGTVRLIDQTNSSLRPAVGTFVIAGGMATEPDGTLWVTTRGISDPRHVRTPDGTWTALPPLVGDGLSGSSTAYGRMSVDGFGQKWVQVRSVRDFNDNIGLLVFDDRSTPTDPSDDVHRFFGSQGANGQGLPSVSVNTFVEDRDGYLWIGTDAGLAFLINNGIVAQDPNAVPIWPQWADRDRGVYALRGLRINGLAVDPANRLWVATDEEGAWLLASVEGGFELVQQFTTDNSPLLSNSVDAVAVDPGTGRVYFATERGLISYQGDALAPATSVGDLFVYPNPVRITGDAAPAVYIEGLVDETELRILAPTGELVARLQTRGGRVRWDGRDEQQALVPSGVYLVVAVDQNGDGTAYGKVAVIR